MNNKIDVVEIEDNEATTKVMKLSETYWKDYLKDNQYNKDPEKMCEICVSEQVKKHGVQVIPCTGLNRAVNHIGKDLYTQLISTLTEEEIKELDAIYDPYIYMDAFLDVGQEKQLESRWYQKLISACSAQSKVIRVGRRSGKTYMMALMMVQEMLLTEKYRVLVISPYAVQTAEVIKTFMDLCSRLPENPIKSKKQTPAWEINFHNGSVLMGFTAATNADSVRGQCLGGETKIIVALDIIINNQKEEGYFYTTMEKAKNMDDTTYSTEGTQFSIYKTTNKENGKEYIGYHSLHRDTINYSASEFGSIYKSGYLGSGTLLKKAIEKYGANAFKQELLYFFNNKEEAEGFVLINKEVYNENTNS